MIPVLDEKGDSLVQLMNTLDSLPMDESTTTIASNLRLIASLASPDHFVPLTKEIMNKSHLLADIASRSYRHVNHFDKIVLVDSAKLRGYRLTLHLWMPPFTQKELKKESLHDHRFSFWSSILTGTLSSENFIESPDGQVMQHYQYVPEERAGDSRNLYKFVGDTRLLKEKSIERRTGESYYQPFLGVHRVLLPKTLSCTLVLRGPRQKLFTNTFRTDIPKVNTEAVNTMFTAAAVEEKLGALLTVIEGR